MSSVRSHIEYRFMSTPVGDSVLCYRTSTSSPWNYSGNQTLALGLLFRFMAGAGYMKAGL